MKFFWLKVVHCSHQFLHFTLSTVRTHNSTNILLKWAFPYSMEKISIKWDKMNECSFHISILASGSLPKFSHGMCECSHLIGQCPLVWSFSKSSGVKQSHTRGNYGFELTTQDYNNLDLIQRKLHCLDSLHLKKYRSAVLVFAFKQPETCANNGYNSCRQSCPQSASTTLLTKP